MTDDDLETILNERHDLKPGDRVEFIEGSGLHKMGLRGGIVVAIDRSLADHREQQAVRLDVTADEITRLPIGKDLAWARRQFWPIVAVDRVEPGSDAAVQPTGTEFAFLPIDLIKLDPPAV